METSFSASTLEAPNQERLQNYSDNIGFGVALNASQQEGKDAMVSRMAGYLNFAEDNGVNLADGATGGEIRSMTDLISADSGFQTKAQDLHQIFTDQFQNTLGVERIFKGKDINATGVDSHGEYGRDGDILRNEDGNANDSVDQDAIDFNDFTGRVITEAPLTAKPQGGGGGGYGGGGAGAASGDGGKGSEAGSAGAESGGNAGNAKEVTDDTVKPTPPSQSDQDGIDARNFWSFILSTFDLDGDGKISADEMQKGMSKLDKNNDGKLTKDELVEGGATEAQAASMMIGMDKDGDKEISLDGEKSEVSEFLIAANPDKNDLITEDEVASAIAPTLALNLNPLKDQISSDSDAITDDQVKGAMMASMVSIEDRVKR
jgi:hypothetical protein